MQAHAERAVTAFRGEPGRSEAEIGEGDDWSAAEAARACEARVAHLHAIWNRLLFASQGDV